MLIRFDPFRDLDRFTEQVRGSSASAGRSVPMDAIRRGDQMLVSFDLPGVDPPSIDVTVEENVLTMTAERRPEREDGDESLVTERPYGMFRRQLFLGETLDTERIEAEYRRGVLTLTIPVAERAKPRKVQIAADDDQQAIEAGNGAKAEGESAGQENADREKVSASA
jgi:HSP20 family protein